jgi:bifunctional UDP-N-acetylglucosamine pyrophosphorylase/glucosamine-1-phosphate N-acetyltransferase
VLDTQVSAHVRIGPFAHLRAGNVVGPNAHIGNFVELKNTTLGPGAKANHLAYLGDAEIGERANIGAGTITCNFDGVKKHRTEIGARAFIGSNSTLVAPLRIGTDALTGGGAVVIRDVADGERVAGNPARPLTKKAQV